MKKRIITITMIALVLTVAMSVFAGCFLQNLSFISGKMSGEAEEAMGKFNEELVKEDGTIVLSNFTQINHVKMSIGNNQMAAARVYKVTETGISMSAGGSADEFYLELDGGYWFVYYHDPNDNTKWKVMEYSEDMVKQSLKAKDSSVSADSRQRLFQPANYKADGKKFSYVGEPAYLEFGGDMKMVFDVEGLFVIENGIEIKGEVVPDMTAEQKQQMAEAGMSLKDMGYEFPFSYSIVDVGTTKITYPSVVNSDYKNQFFQTHERKDNKNNNNNGNNGNKEPEEAERVLNTLMQAWKNRSSETSIFTLVNETMPNEARYFWVDADEVGNGSFYLYFHADGLESNYWGAKVRIVDGGFDYEGEVTLVTNRPSGDLHNLAES